MGAGPAGGTAAGAGPGCRTAVSYTQSRTTIVFTGEIDAAVQAELEQLVAEALERRLPVELDMAGVSFVDSMGLRVLIASEHRASDLRTRLSLVAAGPAVRKVLRLTGLDERFPVPG